MKYLLITCMFFINSAIAGENTMTQDEMETIVTEKVEVINQEKGYIAFIYRKTKMALISDVAHDRMRIIAPITEYPALTSEIKDAVMESNFHLALDARYAASNGALCAAYTSAIPSYQTGVRKRSWSGFKPGTNLWKHV